MSARRKKVESEVSAGAPAYIVTFSDMVTLLITFFVLLLSMANTQDPAKFDEGQEAVKNAFASIGMDGILTGKKQTSSFHNKKIKHAVDENLDQQQDPVIYKSNDELKRAVYQIEEMMTITQSNITGSTTSYTPYPIRFTKCDYHLDRDAVTILEKYCSELEETLSQNNTTIYIIGLAKDFNSYKDNLTLSARRASEVRKFLNDRFSSNPYWNIYYWGAGSGGDWTSKTGLISEDTQIVVGILTAD